MVDFILRISWAIATLVFLGGSIVLVGQYRSRKYAFRGPVLALAAVFLLLYFLFGVLLFVTPH